MEAFADTFECLLWWYCN